MTGKKRGASPETERAIRMYRDRLAEIEESWRFTREGAREVLMRAIDEEGMSVATAAELSGHHRNTVKSWLDVYNAEKKGREKPA